MATVRPDSSASGPTSSLLLLLDGLGGRFELAVAHPGGSELEGALGARGIPSHVVDGLGLGAIPRLVKLIRNEGIDLVAQIEAYQKRFGCYPESVHADKIYRNRDNRRYRIRRLRIVE